MAKQSYAYMKRWHHEAAHGVYRTVDAAPVSDHVHRLLSAGWSLRSIADVAACSPAIVMRLKKRDQGRIRRDLATRIQAVTDESLLTRQNTLGFVRNVGARRRVRALLALGWRHEEITAAMLAASPDCGTRSTMVLHQVGEWITRRTHDAVCVAYDQLGATPGPSGKTRRLAAKYGYAPPLAWDEGAIDDPAAEPDFGGQDQELDDVMVARIAAGELRTNVHANTPELVEAVRRLVEQGLTDREIGVRIGLSGSGAQRLRTRHSIPAAVPAGRTA